MNMGRSNTFHSVGPASWKAQSLYCLILFQANDTQHMMISTFLLIYKVWQVFRLSEVILIRSKSSIVWFGNFCHIPQMNFFAAIVAGLMFIWLC